MGRFITAFLLAAVFAAANQARFIMARDLQIANKDGAEADQLRRTLTEFVDRESDQARRMYGLSSADSRLGYEASPHHFYLPLDLVEKVVNCDDLRTHFAKNSADQVKPR